MNTLYIVIPAYNEEANIETVVKEWYEVIKERSEESRLVVIDDGSKDSTYAIMQKMAETMPKFVPLTKPNWITVPTMSSRRIPTVRPDRRSSRSSGRRGSSITW